MTEAVLEQSRPAPVRVRHRTVARAATASLLGAIFVGNLATAAFAMGAEAGPRWTPRLRGYAAMTILADDTVLSTAAFPHE